MNLVSGYTLHGKIYSQSQQYDIEVFLALSQEVFD